MVKAFRIIALFEGLTTLALFLFAMPAKYLFDQPQFVPPIGMLHGVAWVGYMVAMVVAFLAVRAPASHWLRATFAALVPFGTFLNDRFVRQLQPRRATA
jgi:integral membrane protein